MLDVITYGGGNTGSLLRSLERLNIPFKRVNEGSELGDFPVILPGVGNFGAVMRSLDERGFSERLRVLLPAGLPFLGICVGMQVLFEESEESPGIPGLALLGGTVRRFEASRIPQIGWNALTAGPAAGDAPEGYAYFVNSYYPVPRVKSSILYSSDYSGSFCAAVRAENITAFQFHPEKSGAFGHQLLRRWFDAL